jgi:type I restriction enzyme R subunit
VDELDDSKLKSLLENKYQSLEDGLAALGSTGEVRKLFIEFQQYLYQESVA